MNDAAIVEAQLGRPPRSVVMPVVRCHLDLPVVIEVPPLLDDGTPFPTRYWLTCPLAVRRAGRVESAGGVGRAEARIAADPGLMAAHRAAMERYEASRNAQLPAGYDGPTPSGGVGGANVGVKCLHAHYADFAAGNDNPVGADTAGAVEPLDCTVRCVIDADGETKRNPAWREPQH